MRSARHRVTFAARALAIAACGLGGPAGAQVAVDLEATANVGQVLTTPENTMTSRVDAHPAVTLNFGSPRLMWRARYLFSGSYPLQGEGAISYANELSLSLASTPTTRTSLNLTGGASQGSTIARVSQRPAQTGEPALRAPGNPAQVTGSLNEAFSWEAAPGINLGQTLGVQASAPQDTLDRRSWTLSGSLSFDRPYPRDAVGGTYSARYAELRPVVAEPPPRVEVMAHSAQATWNRDFDQRWNGFLTAGVEAVSLLGGGTNLAYHPTGSFTLRYLAGKLTGGLSYTHGAAANLEEGTMGLSDVVLARGGWTFQDLPLRQLNASLGFLRSRPLRAAGAASTEGTAVNADVGLAWGLWDSWGASVRYSLAYQLARPGNEASAIHVFDVGISWRSNPSPQGAIPSAGGRVDGGDGAVFPGEAPNR